MTGMDVLWRCRDYKKDIARLQLRLGCARDAAMRITRSTDTTGHGGGQDKVSEYASKVDEIEREMRERAEQYARDVALAGQLVTRIDPLQGWVVYLKLVRGLTIRQTAAELRTSESSVRGLYRRGREAMEEIQINE